MKKRKLLSIFLALALVASTSVLLSGCKATVTYNAGQEPQPSQALVTESSAEESSEEESSADESSDSGFSEYEYSEEESSEDESSEEESSEDESSEEESSEEESSEEESSEEESSEDESSEEESSEEESSEEESSAEESYEGSKITFTKPDNWEGAIYAYVYNKDNATVARNAAWPGEPMTDNGDGTYSYIVSSEIGDALVIFSDSNKKQYPLSAGLEVEDGKTYSAS